jgi:hypothetical protein
MGHSNKIFKHIVFREIILPPIRYLVFSFKVIEHDFHSVFIGP